MKFFKSLLTAETALILGAFAIAFLPRAIFPFALILLGGSYLLYVFVRTVKLRILPDTRFGPVSGATFCLLFGICLLFIPDQFIKAAAIAFVLTFVIQTIWAVYGAKSPKSSGDKNESKQQGS